MRLIRTAHMLDFVIFDWETHLLVLMEWGSCLPHVPCSGCFTISLFIISGRISFGVNIFGCIYCTWWWRPYCKMMDHWSWKLITSLIYCRAALKSFNSAWCGIATFFMFRQQLLVHTTLRTKNAQYVSYTHSFLIWFGLHYSSAVVVCVRWESLQVSTIQRVHRGTHSLPWLPSGSLPLPPLAEQQGSFFSTAAHQQQQQLQPQL